MKTETKYQKAKRYLKYCAIEAKATFGNDKPAIRQSINDYADHLQREFDLSEYQINLLSNYACTLHPKN